MQKTRLLALIMALLMLTAIVAGCNDNEPAETTVAPTPGGTTTPAPVTTTEPPGMNGYVFTWGNAHNYPAAGETANDLEMQDIYAEIEAKFDCVIEFVQLGNNDNYEGLVNSVISGVKLADFQRARQSTWIPLSIMGGLHQLDSPEMLEAGLDLFNEDNFHQPYTLMSKLNGKIWALDLSGKYSQMAFGHVYAFNKRLTAEVGYDADTLYQAVRDRTWDYDMFLTIAREVSKDEDGDQINDVWGVALDCDGNEIWSNGKNVGPILQDADGRWYSNLSDPNLIDALTFMSEISGDPHVQVPLTGDAVPSRGARRSLFYEGKAAFAGLYGPNFGEGGTFQCADDIGLLPIPKGPNAEDYMINMVDVDTYISLTSNKDWEKSAVIMNELGNRLHDMDEYKEYIFESLRGDEQAMEVLFDILLPNALMNIAKCSEEMYQMTRYDMYDKIYKKLLTPAAAAETYQGMIQTELDRIFRQS